MAYFSGDLNFPWEELKLKKKKNNKYLSYKVKLAVGVRPRWLTCSQWDESFPLPLSLFRPQEGLLVGAQ